MSQMGVWDRVTREEAQRDPEGKIVGTRWVFVKKGDKVRCRLVAQEFAGTTNERTSTQVPHRCPPPDTCCLTVCQEEQAGPLVRLYTAYQQQAGGIPGN